MAKTTNLLNEASSEMDSLRSQKNSPKPHLPLPTSAQAPSEETQWAQELDGFRIKATTIRKILERFHSSDLPTRKYLRSHLDEEWDRLKESYDSLRQEFGSK